MPYAFVENTVMVSYCGINIYHVYIGNFHEGGVREYWYTTNQYGCEDDEDAFDIRDCPGFDKKLSLAANLVNLIREGHFGPAPDDYDRYVDEEHSFAGCCPACQSTELDYGSLEVQDACVVYPFTCKNCGVTGNEYADLSFNGYSID